MRPSEKFRNGDKIKYVGPDINGYSGRIKHGAKGIVYDVYTDGLIMQCDDGNIKGFSIRNQYWNVKFIMKNNYNWRKL